jgi:hypothetical protein
MQKLHLEMAECCQRQNSVFGDYCCFGENVFEFCAWKVALSNCIFALHEVLRDEAYRLKNNEKLVPICLILHFSCAFGHHAF